MYYNMAISNFLEIPNLSYPYNSNMRILYYVRLTIYIIYTLPLLPVVDL